MLVYQNGDWNIVKNSYVHSNGDWNIINNTYVRNNGGWSLITSPDNNSDSFDYPGSYTFTVPAGVHNLQVSWPTTATVKTATYEVYPGQQIPVNIGAYGTTSTYTIGTDTYVLEAFDYPILQTASEVDRYLGIEYAVSTPTPAYYTATSTSNPTIATNAKAAGCLWNIITPDSGVFNSTVVLSPVLTEVITNPNGCQVIFNNYNGRDPNKYVLPVTRKGDSYVSQFYQNDNPEGGSFTYTFDINLQQIVNVGFRWGMPRVQSSSAVLTIGGSGSFVDGQIFSQSYGSNYSLTISNTNVPPNSVIIVTDGDNSYSLKLSSGSITTVLNGYIKTLQLGPRVLNFLFYDGTYVSRTVQIIG